MRIVLLILVGVISLYHIMLTGMAVRRPEMRVYLPLIRDALRIAVVAWISIVARGKCGLRRIVRPLRQDIWPLVTSIICFLGWAITLTYVGGGTRQHMLIGIKYDIRFFLLGALAVVGGWRLSLVHTTAESHTGIIETKEITHSKKYDDPMPILQKYTSYIWWGLVGIIVAGFLWQLAKIVLPELFMAFGYGPVGDYAYGEHPPIRYRTGPGGTMRRSGLFAGPNNYGYFLVAFFGFFVTKAKDATQLLSKWYRIQTRTIILWGIITLYAAAVIVSFSRGAIIGCLVQLGLLAWQARNSLTSYSPALKKWRSRRGRWVGSVIILLAVAGLGAVSVLKRSSTIEHLQRSKEGVDLVLAQPRGYGLGSSGPAVHRGGKYLPENMYIQVLLDTGRLGFLFRAIARGRWIIWGIRLSRYYTSPVLRGLWIGLIGLSVEGVFLHVWEDSMVNMLFFGLMGLLIGIMLQQRHRHTP